MVVLSTQSSNMGACTTCLIWPHGSSHASKPPKFATLKGLLRILLSGEFKNYQETFLEYAPFVILSVWQSEPVKLHARFWLEPPPQISSLLIREIFCGQTSLSAGAQASKVKFLMASWDETGWWGWGTIVEDGELYWFRLVGRHGLWRDRFLAGNIGSSRIGNSFKAEHWARKISSSE